MPLEIPLDPAAPPVDAFAVTLDGQPYTIQLQLNARAATWAASLYDASGAPLFAGEPLRTGTPLWGAARVGAPPGRFIVAAIGADKSDAGSASTGELGERVFLLYFTAAELAELEAG